MTLCGGRADHGAAIAGSWAPVTVNDSAFENNTTGETGYGGSIWFYWGPLISSARTTFLNNHAGHGGEAINAYDHSGGSLTANSQFVGNSTIYYGTRRTSVLRRARLARRRR